MIRILFIFLWSLALALCLTALLLVITGASLPIAGVAFLTITFFPALVIVLLVAQALRAVARRRTTVVITYLEQAVRLNLPLPRMLQAAAASETAATSRRLSHLRFALETGLTLTDALNVELPEAPARTIALIAASERIGRLPQVLHRLVAEARRRTFRDPTEQTFYVAYPIVMTLVIGGIISMIMIFVIPKFESIFRDFSVELPLTTIWLLRFSRVVSDWLPWALLVAVFLFLTGIVVEYFSRPSQGRRWSIFTGWFTHNRDLADACRVIADSIDADLPLAAALRDAARLPVSRSLCRRLDAWADGIERGQPSADAAKSAHMSNLIIGLAATADITAAREGFVFLWRYYTSRFSRLQQLAHGAAIPAVVFFFAIIVGWVAVSLFAPIVSLEQMGIPILRRP